MKPADVVHGLAVALNWGVAVSRFRAWGLWPDEPDVRANNLAFVFGGVWLTLSFPPIYARVDQLLGMPNVSRLLGDCAIVVAFRQVQGVADYVLGEERDRWTPMPARWGWMPAASLGGMCLAWVGSRLSISTPRGFTETYGGVPYVLEYKLALTSYPALVIYTVARANLHFSSQVADGEWQLQMRMRCMAIGAILCLLYATHEIAHPLLLRLGRRHPPPRPAAVRGALLIGSTVLMTTSGSVFDLAARREQRIIGDRIVRLWMLLRSAVPQVFLPESLAPSDPKARVDGMVAEIKDALRELAWHNDPKVAERALEACQSWGMRGRRVERVVAAAVLACAIDSRAAGEQTREMAVPILSFGERWSYMDGVRALAAISEELVTSPVIDAVRGEVRGPRDARESSMASAARLGPSSVVRTAASSRHRVRYGWLTTAARMARPRRWAVRRLRGTGGGPAPRLEARRAQ